MEEHAYGFGAKTKLTYEEALAETKAALKEEGFGVLSEIDVRKTMKEKLDVEFRPYVILGACNPPLAHRALSAELDLGLLLPCNVIVYDAEGGAVVKVMDPEAVLGMVDNAAILPVAAQVKEKMRRVVERLAAR